MDVETRTRIIPFLRNLAISIENDELEKCQVRCIEDFFIAYQFQTQAVKDNMQLHENNTPHLSREEIIQFITLAWYVYRLLCNNRTL